MAQPEGIYARRAALRLMDAVLRRGETLDQAFGGATRDIRKSADRALARAIVSEALRWLADLDMLIDSATQKRLPDDAKPRMVLRLMLAQRLRLHTPAHAVIATCLPLLSGGPRRLAHGVFSTLNKRGAELPETPTLPAGVRDRWGSIAPQIAAGLVEPPALDLSLRDPSETMHWATRLGGDSYMPGHVRVPRGEAIEKLEGFAEGAWWVQDLAASLPVRLLGKGDGRHVLDLCAAPGGKTMQLAAQGWKVTALDTSKRRLDILKANLKRVGLSASSVRADARAWEPKHQFDAILLDAPCTATGTCRRHPDVVHRVGPRQIGEMAELQRAIVARAINWLKPNATFIYATCSLEREEGEEQAAWIDQKYGMRPIPIRCEDMPSGLQPTNEGWCRTHPGMLTGYGGLDGFFIARWTKS